MKSWIKDGEVRRRIPKGRRLPERFDDFIRAEPPFAVEWNNMEHYCLKESATKEVVPFLRLPDGGLVALWYENAAPAVVHIGGHSELQVLAADFDEFLKAVAGNCSGLMDFDDAEQVFRVPGVAGAPNKEELPALQQRFDAWCKKHTSLLPPLDTPAAEALRKRVHEIAEQMIRDGRSKVYTLSSPWWSMDFQIEPVGKELSIRYRDFGEWHPVPTVYELEREVVALLKLVKRKRRSRYELSISCTGIVSIDQDRGLLLAPPETSE